MEDRVSKYPGRYQVTDVSTGTSKLVDVKRADEPIVEGTPLNKGTLLSDSVAAGLGLTSDATVNDALKLIVPPEVTVVTETSGTNIICTSSDGATAITAVTGSDGNGILYLPKYDTWTITGDGFLPYTLAVDTARQYVVEPRVLPAAYQRVQYLQSTGVQWIDAVTLPPNNFKITLKFNPSGYEYNRYLFGANNYVSDTYFNTELYLTFTAYDVHRMQVTYKYHTFYQGSDHELVASVNTPYERNKVYTLEVYVWDAEIHTKILLDGKIILDKRVATQDIISIPTSLFLFSGSYRGQGGGGSIKAIIYEFAVDSLLVGEEDKKLCDLAACKETALNRGGFYDFVSKTFKPNKGSGDDFILGPEV